MYSTRDEFGTLLRKVLEITLVVFTDQIQWILKHRSIVLLCVKVIMSATPPGY